MAHSYKFLNEEEEMNFVLDNLKHSESRWDFEYFRQVNVEKWMGYAWDE